MEYNLAHHDAMVRPYPGVTEMIGALVDRGVTLGIVTSKLGDTAVRGLRVAGLDGAFDVIVAADDVTCGKPDPEPVLLALSRCGSFAAATIFVGDSPHDVEAGNRAHVSTAAATWGPYSRRSLEAAHPSFFVERPGEVLALERLFLGSMKYETPLSMTESGAESRFAIFY